MTNTELIETIEALLDECRQALQDGKAAMRKMDELKGK